jgi:hypothetical protein
MSASDEEINQKTKIKPSSKKAKIDTSKWPILMKVNKIK